MTLKDVVKDEFYIQLYDYYYNRGFTPILLTYICEIFSMLFGILFFYFFISIDWENILKCVDNNCGDISQYVISKPMNFLNICILMLSVTVTLYKIITFIPKIYTLNTEVSAIKTDPFKGISCSKCSNNVFISFFQVRQTENDCGKRERERMKDCVKYEREKV